MEPLDRRSFLKSSTILGTTAICAPAIVPASALGREQDGGSPNEKVRIGLIGCNGMGMSNARNVATHPNAEIAAVCDVFQARRDAALAIFPNAKGFGDYRELLAAAPDRGGVDAVIVAPPPHWHALIAIDACKAGKDIYVQKPMTLYPAEGIALRNAVRKHNVISQVGTQIHAGENYRRVVELVRAGRVGKVSIARTFNVMNQGRQGIGTDPNTTPPEGFDWDFWLGPGPERPYNGLLAANSYNHCSFWPYSRGWTPGMAPHIIDLPIWALNLGAPTAVSCSGGRYLIQDDGDAPDVQEMVFTYPDFTLTWSMSAINSFGFDFGRGTPARRLGIYFHGDRGTLFSDYGKYEIVPEGDYYDESIVPAETIPPSPGQEHEWAMQFVPASRRFAMSITTSTSIYRSHSATSPTSSAVRSGSTRKRTRFPTTPRPASGRSRNTASLGPFRKSISEKVGFERNTSPALTLGASHGFDGVSFCPPLIT